MQSFNRESVPVPVVLSQHKHLSRTQKFCFADFVESRQGFLCTWKPCKRKLCKWPRVNWSGLNEWIQLIGGKSRKPFLKCRIFDEIFCLLSISAYLSFHHLNVVDTLAHSILTFFQNYYNFLHSYRCIYEHVIIILDLFVFSIILHKNEWFSVFHFKFII